MDLKLEADYDHCSPYLAMEIIIESLKTSDLSEKLDLFPTKNPLSERDSADITSGAFVEWVNRNPNNIDEMLRGYYLER